MISSTINRRTFLATIPLALTAAHRASADEGKKSDAPRGLAGERGVTTGSFVRHLVSERTNGKLELLDLPAIMRDELDLRVIDLMTATLPSLEPAYCERLRGAAEKAGCVITNLKMNQKDIDMASPDESKRGHAITVYKKTMDAAARLGCRWVRPLPGNNRPDLSLFTAGYRELIEYGGPLGITLLVENNGWMKDDPEAIPGVIAAVGKGIGAQPDTGNWTARARYEGLKKAFPHAVSCDFKALKLGPHGEHTDYDLRRCFDLAWEAGFRGPWCFEHFHDELPQLFRELKFLGEMLKKWTREKESAK